MQDPPLTGEYSGKGKVWPEADSLSQIKIYDLKPKNL
jgi:hypothetical protein